MKIKFNKNYLILFVVLLFILLVECAIKWTFNQFGRVNMDEVLLVINSGPGGMDMGLVWSFVKKVVMRAFGWATALTILCAVFKRYKIVTWASVIAVSGVFLYRLVSCNIQMGSFFNFKKSDFYQKHYIDPNTAKISFPEKRNIVVIALESMEKIYADEKLFGDGGIIPNITKMEQEHFSFENYNSLSGLSHTIAAITGFTTGLPLFYTSYRNIEKMRGASGIGTIFKNNGYQTWAIFPASGNFSKKSGFLTRMGFDRIYDGHELRDMLDYELDVAPFQGVDDYTLFELSKPIITNIIKSDQPYFIFMETVNTHCEGYFTDACRKMGFAQETMEDIAKCDDKIIYDFVQWMRQADPSAVIILLNDHPQHSGEIMKKLSRIKNRPLANVFINTNIFDGANMSRPVAAFDFFPTIIESAGGEIHGCRLGLGTSLSARCGANKTLREQYGDAPLEKLMEQRNDLYYKLASGVDKK